MAMVHALSVVALVVLVLQIVPGRRVA